MDLGVVRGVVSGFCRGVGDELDSVFGDEVGKGVELEVCDKFVSINCQR